MAMNTTANTNRIFLVMNVCLWLVLRQGINARGKDPGQNATLEDKMITQETKGGDELIALILQMELERGAEDREKAGRNLLFHIRQLDRRDYGS